MTVKFNRDNEKAGIVNWLVGQLAVYDTAAVAGGVGHMYTYELAQLGSCHCHCFEPSPPPLLTAKSTTCAAWGEEKNREIACLWCTASVW